MVNGSIEHEETNRSCWEKLSVFIVVNNDIISEMVFSGHYSLKTARGIECTKLFLLWKEVNQAFLMKREAYIIETWETNKKKIDYMVYSLLCVRNAINKLNNNGIVDDFSDLE